MPRPESRCRSRGKLLRVLLGFEFVLESEDGDPQRSAEPLMTTRTCWMAWRVQRSFSFSGCDPIADALRSR